MLRYIGQLRRRLDNNGLYILLGPWYFYLYLHPPSWVRISGILSMKEGGRNLYSEATLEVGRLEQCLDAIKTTLSTSEEETNVA